MRDVLAQVVDNLRANRLRSLLTMFGILWGVVTVVVLSATGEGFQRGNQSVLEQLGRDIAIVWGGRTSMQAGGERAGRPIRFTVRDARLLERESAYIAVVSAEIQRGDVSVRSAYNAASLMVHGIEPQYQRIRTLELAAGRYFNALDDEERRRVAILGADAARQLFGEREAVGERIYLNGLPFLVAGRLLRKEQDSNYSGPDNDKIFIPFGTMARDVPRTGVPPGTLSQLIVVPHPWVLEITRAAFVGRTGRTEDVDWPIEREIRRVLAPSHGFDPDDRNAIAVWDTALSSLMFARMIQSMRDFFSMVGIVTLALGGLGVMNIMFVAVQERTREIGVRKALGATTAQIQRQFFLEGFLLTSLSGAIGFAIAMLVCAAVNQLPMPNRFEGMIVTWFDATIAAAALVLTGAATATWPARRAARLPPAEALRYEK